MIDTLVTLLGLEAHDPRFWMPLLFAAVLLIIIVCGSVFEGLDTGVGCLSLIAPPPLQSRMLSLLGPWRDANSYWLLLGLGVLFAAFPGAWASIFGRLYLPLMLLGLGVLLRTSAYELRARAPHTMQAYWARVFGLGSLLSAFSQGWVLARIVAGPAQTTSILFSLLLGLCALAWFCLLGATWLIMREGGALRARAALWARSSIYLAAAGVTALSVVLAFSNTGVYLKWTEGLKWPRIISLWLLLLFCFVGLDMGLRRLTTASLRFTSLPFATVLFVFLVLVGGLIYSFFPYLVLDEMTIWDAAASTSSLRFVIGLALVALPVALVFNGWVYRGFLGRSKPPAQPRSPFH